MLGGDVGPVKARPPAAAAGTVELRVMVAMLEAMHRSRSAAEKRKKFRKFMDYCCPPRLYFPALRLLLPSLDRQRGSYGLKESVLATSLVDALAISRDSDDALRLLNWRKGGPKAGANVGNFALVASEVIFLLLLLLFVVFSYWWSWFLFVCANDDDGDGDELP